MPAKETNQQENLGVYDLFIAALTVLSLLIIVLLLVLPADAEARDVLLVIDIIICLIFLYDFFRLLYHADNRARYMKKQGIFDFLGSIPAFQLLRILRSFRLVFIVRGLIGKQKQYLHIFQASLAESALYITFFLAIVLLTLGSIAVVHFEQADPHANITNGSDAIWWGIVTISTVGYGDLFPITPGGRFVGTLIMFIGIAMFGVISSFLAKQFLTPTSHNNPAQSPESKAIAELHREVSELRGQIGELTMLIERQGIQKAALTEHEHSASDTKPT